MAWPSFFDIFNFNFPPLGFGSLSSLSALLDMAGVVLHWAFFFSSLWRAHWGMGHDINRAEQSMDGVWLATMGYGNSPDKISRAAFCFLQKKAGVYMMAGWLAGWLEGYGRLSCVICHGTTALCAFAGLQSAGLFGSRGVLSLATASSRGGGRGRWYLDVYTCSGYTVLHSGRWLYMSVSKLLSMAYNDVTFVCGMTWPLDSEDLAGKTGQPPLIVGCGAFPMSGLLDRGLPQARARIINKHAGLGIGFSTKTLPDNESQKQQRFVRGTTTRGIMNVQKSLGGLLPRCHGPSAATRVTFISRRQISRPTRPTTRFTYLHSFPAASQTSQCVGRAAFSSSSSSRSARGESPKAAAEAKEGTQGTSGTGGKTGEWA